MMDHHKIAWQKVQPQIFGKVCEVSRVTPWGFCNDDPQIKNQTVDDFLSSQETYHTVILHILSGESVATELIAQTIRAAVARCIKLIILEHNPDSGDISGLRPVDWMIGFLSPNRVVVDNWGRNLMMYCSTTAPLQIPEISNDWYRENINRSYVHEYDCGIDKRHLIYTHTSETRIDFDLPEGTIYWVAGGGLALESMKRKNRNVIFDSIFRQCVYTAFRTGLETWKAESLVPGITSIYAPSYLPQTGGRPDHWRRVEWNHIRPDEIIVAGVEDLHPDPADTVYVSTVEREKWNHLPCNLIDAFTERDHPKLIMR